MAVDLATIGVGVGNITVWLAVLYNIRKNRTNGTGGNGLKAEIRQHAKDIGNHDERIKEAAGILVAHGQKIVRAEVRVEAIVDGFKEWREDNRKEHKEIYDAIKRRS